MPERKMTHGEKPSDSDIRQVAKYIANKTLNDYVKIAPFINGIHSFTEPPYVVLNSFVIEELAAIIGKSVKLKEVNAR